MEGIDETRSWSHLTPQVDETESSHKPLGETSGGYCQANVTFSSDNLSHREQTGPMPQQYSDLRV